ncbi:hypothetical protein DB345_17815 [Spartobacteria bacterium LR76]|nr:hypothetical protein DB345_17815 [Spartobacteria bacterium LR76]
MIKLEERYKEIPEPKRIPPPTEIASPSLDELLKVDDELLTEMFIELLAKASDISPEHKIHRAFISSLRELVPDEALIVKTLEANSFLPFVRFMGDEFIPFSEPLTYIDEKAELSLPASIPLYLENLVRVGIFECKYDLFYQGSEEIYQNLINKNSCDGYAFSYQFNRLEPFRPVKDGVFWKRGFYRYTLYGEKFRDACCRKTN